MNFTLTLPKLIRHFDNEKLNYALIGGLAMAMRGVQRSTLDADFILLAEDLEHANSILCEMGYERKFHSENVSHYLSENPELGRVDLLHAFRSATLGMLKRSQRIKLTDDCLIPVVHLEDLVGLKVQAACNDPRRAQSDWADIHRLILHAGQSGDIVDWELINDYLSLFNQSEKLEQLKQLHGTAQSK